METKNIKEKIEISEETLHKLFKIHDVMGLLEEWEDYDAELKANYLFNILKNIRDKKNDKFR